MGDIAILEDGSRKSKLNLSYTFQVFPRVRAWLIDVTYWFWKKYKVKV